MSYEKVSVQNIYTFADQDSDIRMPVGGASASQTATHSRFVGDKLWNNCVYTLNNFGIGGGATGGSYSLTVEGLIDGVTVGIARVTGLGPNSVTTQILDNLFQSPGGPTPIGVSLVQVSAGGTFNGVVSAIGKTYRGVLPSGPRDSFRVAEGVLMTYAGLAADITTDLIANPAAGGTFGSNGALNRLYLWDAAYYCIEIGLGLTGTWDIDIIGEINGATVTLARTGTGGSISATEDGTNLPLANQFYGCCVRPTQIIVTEETDGGISFSVHAMAKANRGQRHKL